MDNQYYLIADGDRAIMAWSLFYCPKAISGHVI